ncbi:DUF5994 family protein [Nocardia sp. Marseille-Q1738]
MTPLSTNVHPAPLRRTPTHTPRLRLRPDSDTSSYIDVVWWPRSSNLITELPDLIIELQPRTGPIWRIVYDPRAWSPTDRHLIMDDRTIRLDPYPFELFGTVYMCGTDGSVTVLQAIPSGADAAFARSALAAAGG